MHRLPFTLHCMRFVLFQANFFHREYLPSSHSCWLSIYVVYSLKYLWGFFQYQVKVDTFNLLVFESMICHNKLKSCCVVGCAANKCENPELKSLQNPSQSKEIQAISVVSDSDLKLDFVWFLFVLGDKMSVNIPE